MSKEFSRTIPSEVRQQLIPSFARKFHLDPDQGLERELDQTSGGRRGHDFIPSDSSLNLQVGIPIEPLASRDILQSGGDVFVAQRNINNGLSSFDPSSALAMIEQSKTAENVHADLGRKTLTQRLFQVISPDIYNKAGSVLRDLLLDGTTSTEKAVAEIVDRYQELPKSLAEELVRSFVDTGFVKQSEAGAIKLTRLGINRPSLGYWDLKSVFTSSDALKTQHKPIESWDDVIVAQEATHDRFRVPDVEIKSGKHNRTLWLDGIIVGSSVTDAGFVKQVIEAVKELPKPQKPDAIVIGNIVEGTHKHTNVDATSGLSLQRSDDQFKASKKLIEMLREIDVPIVYVMGVNDRNHIRDGAIEAVKVMQNIANPLRDSQKPDYLGPEDLHAIQSNREYPIHKVFEHDVIFEYMLRVGRGLMSADEVEASTNAKIRMEEYVMLWDAYKALKLAWDKGHHKSFVPADVVPPEYQRVIDVNSIPGPWLKDTFTVTDGANISLEGKKHSEVTMWVRNRFKMDGPTIHQEIMANPMMVQKELVMNGEPIPDLLVSTGNYEGVITATRHGAVLDLPGMVSSRDIIDMQGIYAQAGKNPAMRAVYTRKRPTEPGAVMTSLKDGLMEISFFDKKLMKAVESIPETTIYATVNDIQIGSGTSDQRRAILWIRHILKDLPNRGNVRMVLLGDITHGATVYKNFPNEINALGLQRVPDQQEVFERMLRRITSDMSKRELRQAVEKHLIVAGNHEFDGSKYSETGINGLRDLDRTVRMWLGVDIDDPLVKSTERILTKEGDFIDAHIIKDSVGEFTTVFQHKILDKMMKGSSGGLPVYQAISLLRGLGLSASEINMALFAHWHHFQALMHQHMLLAVAPALAKESGFELKNGYQAVTGGMAVVLEPDMPLKILHYNAQALDRLVPSGGEFSPKELAMAGFVDDPDYNPMKDSLVMPTSGINKQLEADRYQILRRHTDF
jgi:hypothetical protein